MTEMLVAGRYRSLRRPLAALVAAVMLVSLGIGLAASPSQAADEKVIVTFTFDDASTRCSPSSPRTAPRPPSTSTPD